MQFTSTVKCPHCQIEQQKQITIGHIDDRYRPGQSFTCEKGGYNEGGELIDKGCGNDFVIYYRSVIEVKAARIDAINH